MGRAGGPGPLLAALALGAAILAGCERAPTAAPRARAVDERARTDRTSAAPLDAPGPGRAALAASSGGDPDAARPPRPKRPPLDLEALEPPSMEEALRAAAQRIDAANEDEEFERLRKEIEGGD